MKKTSCLEEDNPNSSVEVIELNMLERMAINVIAERAFKNNIKYTEELEGKDMEYISNLGKEAEKVFYICIQALKNKRKFSKKSIFLQKIYCQKGDLE